MDSWYHYLLAMACGDGGYSVPHFLHLLNGRHNSSYFIRMLWEPHKNKKGLMERFP